MNLKILFRKVYNDETAIQFLQENQIVPKEQFCANGHNMHLSFTPGETRWRCCKRICRVNKGIRQGNWLEGTRLPLESVVHFIYCWAREMSSVKFCEKELSMAHATIIEWNNNLRELCVQQMEQRDTEIGGEGLYVEIDDCLLSRKSNGKILSQQRMFGGLCKETKDCFLVQIPDRSADTLMPIIKQKIKSGSIIVSDSWQIYRNIATDDLNFIDPETLESTQQERLWGSAKWRNKKREASFLAEFMWRTTLENRDPFYEILNDIATFK